VAVADDKQRETQQSGRCSHRGKYEVKLGDIATPTHA
jgi:hypothetical protein